MRIEITSLARYNQPTPLCLSMFTRIRHESVSVVNRLSRSPHETHTHHTQWLYRLHVREEQTVQECSVSCMRDVDRAPWWVLWDPVERDHTHWPRCKHNARRCVRRALWARGVMCIEPALISEREIWEYICVYIWRLYFISCCSTTWVEVRESEWEQRGSIY